MCPRIIGSRQYPDEKGHQLDRLERSKKQALPTESDDLDSRFFDIKQLRSFYRIGG